MNDARHIAEALRPYLGGSLSALYLYGSAAMDDFRPGWSDIDVLCLLDAPPTEAKAAELVTLRQRLVAETGDPMFRSLEGAIAALPDGIAGWSTGAPAASASRTGMISTRSAG